VAVRARLTQAWRELCASSGLHEAHPLGAALIEAYSESHRRYHDCGHLAYLLDEIERRSALIHDAALLRFAAWFHDAIYDPLAKDNEARSADWAQRDLLRHGMEAERAEAIARLVHKTASHHAGEARPDEALFLDMDFSILGSDRQIYAIYADAIRAEYAAVPDDAFRAGRVAFLKNVLTQPRMFRTEVYEREMADAARANIAWEIARLEV